MKMRSKQKCFTNKELDINKIKTDYDKIRIRLEAEYNLS